MPTPTTTMFCLPDEVQAHMNVANNWSGDDPQITTHIKTATALIRNFTRRSWELGAYTQFFGTRDIEVAIGRGSNLSRWTLNEKPLISVTSIKFNTAGDFANTDPLDTSYYEVDLDRNAVVMYPGVMRSHARSLQIVYQAGYAVNPDETELLDVSESLKQACAIQAAATFTRTLNQTTGKSQKQDQKGFANFATSSAGLVKEAQALLRGHTRLLMGSG